MTDKDLALWRKNPVTGLWRHGPGEAPESGDAWLSVFRADEPAVEFRASRNKPKDKT